MAEVTEEDGLKCLNDSYCPSIVSECAARIVLPGLRAGNMTAFTSRTSARSSVDAYGDPVPASSGQARLVEVGQLTYRFSQGLLEEDLSFQVQYSEEDTGRGQVYVLIGRVQTSRELALQLGSSAVD